MKVPNLSELIDLGSSHADHVLTWIVVSVWTLIVAFVLLATVYQRRRTHAVLLKRAAGQMKHVNLTLSSVSDGVIHTDAEGNITFCNAAAAKILGVPIERILGQPFKSAVPVFKGEEQVQVDNPATFSFYSDVMAYLDPYSGVRAANGEIRPISETISPVHDEEGNVAGAVFVFHDISDARDLSDQLSYQARHDILTGLPNRTAFEQTLASFIESIRNLFTPAFLMYLDLDHFKMINDAQGHAVGDQLLREVATLLRKQLPAGDILARLGGDEFAVISCCSDASQAKEIANGLIAAVSAYRLGLDGQKFEVGLSIGIVAIKPSQGDLYSLMSQADTACYAAKDRGRGRCHLYLADDPHIATAERTLNWANLIQRAFDDNRFEVYLQEIVGRERQVLGYESLIRMHSENGDVIMPGVFMPAAQRMGWMTRIDQWMLKHVIALACGWPLQNGKRPYISLNLCARSIGDPVFVERMLEMLDASSVDCRILRFEITETDELQVSTTEMRLIEQLHKRGFRVWLDDVGTGYNSFDLLKRLHVDGIKIDRSFTHALVIDPVDHALTEALISIGKTMCLEIVAEGVEDEATYQALLDMNADAFQGHRFHRAESAADVLLNQAVAA